MKWLRALVDAVQKRIVLFLMRDVIDNMNQQSWPRGEQLRRVVMDHGSLRFEDKSTKGKER